MRSFKVGLTDILGLSCLLAIYAKLQSLAGDPGFGWHLKSGELISKSGSVPRVDPFFEGEGSRLWIHNQYLADEIFYRLFDYGDFPLLTAVAVLLLISSYFLLLGGMLRKLNFSPLVIFVVLGLCIFQGSLQWFLRPVLFSFFLFALTYSRLVLMERSIVENKSKSSKIDYLLFPLIFLLWAKLHPAFILGLFLIVLFLIGLGIDGLIREKGEARAAQFKKGVYLLMLAIVATLLNPYGLELFKSIFALSQSNFFMNLNSEWYSSDLWIKVFLPFSISALLVFGLVLSKFGKGLSSFSYLLIAVFISLALYQRRIIPYYGVATSYPLALMLAALFSELRNSKNALLEALFRIEMRQVNYTKSFYTKLLVMIMMVSVLSLKTFPGKANADLGFSSIIDQQALALLEEKKSGRIFHSPDLGGFLIWSLWPEKNASIDDRNILNGEEAYKKFFQINNLGRGWREALIKEGYSYLIISPTSALAIALSNIESRSDNLWKEFYRSEKLVMFELDR